MAHSARTLGALTSVSLLAAGCSLLVPSDDEYVAGSVAGAGGSTSGAAGAGTGGAAGSSGGAGSAGLGGNAGSAGAACTPQTHSLEQLASAVYVLVDRGAQDDLDDVPQAFEQFADSAEPGTALALQLIPPLSTPSSCAGSGYDSPAVAMANLPGVMQPIAQLLAMSTPEGGLSELRGVLLGGVSYALGHALTHPERQVNLLLISAFDPPEACGAPMAELVAVARTAAHSEPPVRTHVVRMQGGSLATLSSIAEAGGSQFATTANSDNEIEEALARAATSCRFALPPGLGGGSFAATLLAGQGNELPLAATASAATCAGEEYFFSSGQSLVLCPQACAKLSSQISAQVELVVTCP